MSGRKTENFAKFVGHASFAVFMLMSVLGVAFMVGVVVVISHYIRNDTPGDTSSSPVQQNPLTSAPIDSPAESIAVKNGRPPVTHYVIDPISSAKEQNVKPIARCYLFTIANHSGYLVWYRFKETGGWSSERRLDSNYYVEEESTSPNIVICFNPSIAWQTGAKQYMIDDTLPVIDRYGVDSDWNDAPHYHFLIGTDGQLDLVEVAQSQHSF